MLKNLLIYDESRELFAVDEVSKMFSFSERFCDERSAPDVVAAVQATYACDGTDAIVRLNSKLHSLSVEGSFDSILLAAVALQAASSRRLRTIDQGYSFDLPLAGETAASLREKIVAELGG